MTDVRNLSNFVRAFDWSKRDPRVDDWPFMASPWPTVALSVLYLYVAVKAGPSYMRERKPMEVKAPLMVYNLMQIGANIWLLVNYMKYGWMNGYSLICQPVDTNPDPTSNGWNMAYVVWVAYLVRFVDCFDTLFFLARKKFGHVNTLQVVHHSLMPMYGWLIVRYLPGGQDSFGPMFNAFIHSVMYTYYFLAALGPQYQKYLWWKRHLTSLQIVQFIAVFAKDIGIVFGWQEDCGFPWQMAAITVGVMTLMLVLFTQFYIRTYVQKGEKTKKKT